MTDLPNDSMEVWEPVSHSRIWRLNFMSSDSRAWRDSRDVEREVAIMVLEPALESWVTNSRPRPRLAPVITQTGIVEV